MVMTPHHPTESDVESAVEWIQRHYLAEKHGDHNPFPTYIKTLIHAAREAVELRKEIDMLKAGDAWVESDFNKLREENTRLKAEIAKQPTKYARDEALAFLDEKAVYFIQYDNPNGIIIE